MGNIYSKLPITSSSALIANLALCGAPFLSGFYSKDLIIESIFISNINIFLIIIFILATILTAAYSFRFLIILFNEIPLSSSHSQFYDINPSSFSLIFISLGAISGGSFIR